jgi:hypothetical protein
MIDCALIIEDSSANERNWGIATMQTMSSSKPIPISEYRCPNSRTENAPALWWRRGLGTGPLEGVPGAMPTSALTEFCLAL